MSGQLCPGGLPVLVVEQTVLRSRLPSANTDAFYEPKSTMQKDWPVSFQPKFSHSYFFISLSLESCVAKGGPFMVHCTMTGVCTLRSQAKSESPGSFQSEAMFYIKTEKLQDLTNVVTLEYIHGHPFDAVTVLYRVYDMASTQRPSFGPSPPHLNRARLEGDLCDMTVVVDGAELRAHRAVLAVRSPVLRKMVTGDFTEAREGRVDIVDFSKEVVEKFLEFLYTDRVQDWGSSEPELLQLADKYMVPDLRRACLLQMYTAEPVQAVKLLPLLHAAAAGRLLTATLGAEAGSLLHRRLATIVKRNHGTLKETKEWAEFKENFPLVVDLLLTGDILADEMVEL